MFVCMFYLSPRSRIIVSIWETSELKRENIRRKKREKEEEEAKVESLRYKRFIVYSLKTFAEIFCYFFLFLYFKDSCERGLFNRALFSTFLISLLFLFFFFLFFFWSRQQVSPFGTCNGSNLSYRTLFFFFLIAKKHVARLAGLFFSRSRGPVSFPVGILPLFFFFELQRVRKSDSALRLARVHLREMCFTQNIRSRVTRKKKMEKIKTPNCIILCLCVNPLNTKNKKKKLREKQNRKTTTSINVNKHTDPRIEVFCDSSWCERALARGSVIFDHAPAEREKRFVRKIFQLFHPGKGKQRSNLTVVACVSSVVTRLFEKLKPNKIRRKN